MAYKILIIDDDMELLKMLKKYLEIKKYEIMTAENGVEGLHKIKLQPDIILLDVNMPKMSGLELLKELQKNIKYRYMNFYINLYRLKADQQYRP